MKAFTLTLALILTSLSLSSIAQAGWTERRTPWGTTVIDYDDGTSIRCRTTPWGTVNCR